MEALKTESLKDLMQEALAAETEGDTDKAVSLYKKIISIESLQEQAYDRLFIMLRKVKDYKQELKMINAGIKAFEAFHKKDKSKSKKIAEISKFLNKSTGLTDKKGNSVYKPEPIGRWEKRKALVEKKLK